MKTFLSGKSTIFSQITIEKNKIISHDLSRDFSTFFENVVRPLNVNPDEYQLSETKNLGDFVEIAIKTFKNHPSVLAIKQNISVNPRN